MHPETDLRKARIVAPMMKNFKAEMLRKKKYDTRRKKKKLEVTETDKENVIKQFS